MIEKKTTLARLFVHRILILKEGRREDVIKQITFKEQLQLIHLLMAEVVLKNDSVSSLAKEMSTDEDSLIKKT